MNEQQVLAEVFELLKEHYPYVREFLFSKVPAAKEILAGPSAAEQKLRELQRKDGVED